MSLFHGGDLAAAEKAFGIKREHWLDLSTGINPNGWPVPELPAEIFQRLPFLDDALIAAASSYYRCDTLLPIPGSQFAIQALPGLFPKCTVAIPNIAYQEHRAAWVKARHKVVLYADNEINGMGADIESGRINHLLVINPNNPTCKLIEKKQLKSYLLKLKKRNGFMIIDETFMDVMPGNSMIDCLDTGHLIILRSLGKFFGLAGVRLGFLLAEIGICNKIQEQLGPWAVSGPAQWIGIQALSDTNWQSNNRQYLYDQSKRLADYLKKIFSEEMISADNTPLYVTLNFNEGFAISLYEQLAEKGILVRYIALDNKTACLRFGLLNGDQQWFRLKSVLKTLSNK